MLNWIWAGFFFVAFLAGLFRWLVLGEPGVWAAMVASKDFLKKFLVTAPANKVLTFGGDYIPVEPVVGHARIAREGISLALAELVEEGWLSLDDALSLVEPLLNGNARALFDVDEKTRKLASAPWL